LEAAGREGVGCFPRALRPSDRYAAFLDASGLRTVPTQGAGEAAHSLPPGRLSKSSVVRATKKRNHGPNRLGGLKEG